MRNSGPDLLPVPEREAGEGEQVVGGVAQHRLDLGELPAEHAGDDVELVADVVGVGLGEDRCGPRRRPSRRCPSGTWASTLRRKCTRQRCQAAPSSTPAIAGLRPAWASEMTSCTPASPRAFSERRNAVQNAPSSQSPTANPRTSRRPSARDPGGDHDGLGDDPAVDPGLAVGGVEEHVRERRRRPAAGRGTRRPQRPGRRRSGDTSDLEIPVSAPSALTRSSTLRVDDAVQVGLHHHREQGLIDPAAALQQRREERPGPQLRDPQLQIPGRRRQRPGPVPVALRGPGSVRSCGPAPITAVSSASINA